MQLAEIVSLHEKFEEQFWDAAKDEPGYTRHVLEHMAKLLGKMGNVVEPREHGLEPDTKILKTQVIPDLLYFAIGLARKHEVNLEEAFLNRLEENGFKISHRRQGILEEQS